MAKSVRNFLVVSTVLAGLSAVDAAASTGPDAGMPRADTSFSSHASPVLQLAQYGNVEIYIDEYGRRVIVDSYTGEVLGVERPRAYRNKNAYRRALRARELGRDPGYDIYDPNSDIPYKPREYSNGQPLEGEPDYQPEYAYPENAFPEAPEAYPVEPEARERIERKALETAPADDQQAAIENPGQPTDVIPNEGTSSDDSSGSLDGAQQPSVTFGARDEVAALQVLLDRRGASPGVIDGHFGGNVDKALAAYRDITNENLHSTDTARIKTNLAATGGDPFMTYTITAEDAAGPYVASVPADYGEKARLDKLSYTSVSEMLAERFHMDEAYLKALNPGANFGRQGTKIKVVNIGSNVSTSVARIVADKGRKQVRAYNEAGKLVAAYPATIGSADTPSPSGTHEVSRVAFDPEYTYNPSLNFKQGDNDKILTIPPGPNGPVGSIWIALDKPTYGIHGTPDPSKIGKTESHGCVRLTNWDAAELAKLVQPGVEVEFVD